MHKAARRWHLARYVPGETRCAIGAEALTQPARYLDLAHSDDGRQYLGLACRKHNRGDADGRAGGNRYGGRSYGRVGSKNTSKIASKRVANEPRKRSSKQRNAAQRDDQRRQQLDQRERERLDRMRRKPASRKII